MKVFDEYLTHGKKHFPYPKKNQFSQSKKNKKNPKFKPKNSSKNSLIFY